MARLGSRPFLLLLGVSALAVGLMATARAQPNRPSTSPNAGQPLKPANADPLALSNHLNRRGALFYGAWWCPACIQQKTLFGQDAGKRLPYVECDKSDAGRARCQAASIRAFPTWDLPGKPRLEGVQSLEELKVWSDFRGGQ